MDAGLKTVDTMRYLRATQRAAQQYRAAIPEQRKYTDMATIGKTLERLRTENYDLAETALRRFVKDRSIPSVMCGNKALLYYPNVIKFLTGGDK